MSTRLINCRCRSEFTMLQLGSSIRGDQGDRSASSHEQVVQTRIASIIYSEKSEADMALVAARQAGVASKDCMDCGGEISEARLRAKPAARRCTGCQEIFEADQKRRFGRN